MSDPFGQLLELCQEFKKENGETIGAEGKCVITLFLAWAQMRFDYDKDNVEESTIMLRICPRCMTFNNVTQSVCKRCGLDVSELC